MKDYSVIDHILYLDGIPVRQRPSPNHGGHMNPTLVVIHYTGDNSRDGALEWLCTRKSGVSAHLVIAKDGAVYQLIPFNETAWHAGVSEYDGRRSVNSFSIGIENVGIGDNWPEEQIESIRGVITALGKVYQIEDIVGHEDVALPPGRKVDPGPNFPWDKVVDRQEV
jgi:N-acetylmuramoyl-L-alanine amidase